MKKILLFVFSLLAISSVNAQYYYITGSSQNPKGLNTDLEYPEGGGQPAGWSKILSGPATTPAWSSVVTIPFTFNFNGNPVTDFKVSSSGVLTFTPSATTVPDVSNSALPSASLPDNSVCIWGLQSAAAGDNIYTKSFGTAPNRQFWIQFNSYSEPGLGTGYTYWGIVLEETSNKIYIVDQRGSVTTTTLTLGIQENITTAVQVSGSPNITIKAGTNAEAVDNYYYEFLPGTRPIFDLALTAVKVPADLAIGQAPFTINGAVANYGSTTITSFKISYTIDGGTAVVGTVTGVNIPTNTTYNFSHPTSWTPASPATYQIELAIVDMNGGNPDLVSTNDKMSAITKVWEAFTPRRALHEIFTSSTCPPCKPGNTQMHNVIGQHLGKFAVIKYQYYFPSLGDPYFTLEAYNRGNSYYGGVNSIPYLAVDGGWNSNPNSYTDAIFKQFADKPAFCEINVTQTVTGKKVDVTATVKPLIDMPAGNYKIRMAIVEKVTYSNVKTNGETEFFWVMKKMLPNEAGTAFTFPAKNTPTTINQTYTFPGSYKLATNARSSGSAAPTGTNYTGINIATENSVEDFSNLAVVVFIQNDANKEVIQSAWTSHDWAVGNEETKLSNVTEFKVYPNPANGSFQINLGSAILDSDLEVLVYDITGKIVTQKVYKADELNDDLTIDCSKYTKGAYIVEIRNGSTKSVQKLMVQ